MSLFKKKKPEELSALPANLPRHIGIIMDGNGRWAQKRNLPRNAGHAAGAETFRTIANYCKSIGIEYLTVYAFSTENWKRPLEEVSGIFRLLEKYLDEAIENMVRDKNRLFFFGDLSPFPEHIQRLCDKAVSLSREIDGFQANLCVNYGGRHELMRAIKRIANDCAAGFVKENNITEKLIADYLDSAGIPDPELIIRPSGELRTSNFLLWQSAYSELYFTDLLWPDFTAAELDKALIEYGRRERRFGGVMK